MEKVAAASVGDGSGCSACMVTSNFPASMRVTYVLNSMSSMATSAPIPFHAACSRIADWRRDALDDGTMIPKASGRPPFSRTPLPSVSRHPNESSSCLAAVVS